MDRFEPAEIRMGFQDRVYYREPTPRGFAEWTAVNTIIAVTVAVWLANFIIEGNLFREIVSIPVSLNGMASLKANLFQKPWQAWQLLTYGFLHHGLWHIVGNMLTLWFFGQPVEERIGKTEFFRFYFVAIILAGLTWVISVNAVGFDPKNSVVGASGGVSAVLAAFIWYFPRETILFMGVFPMPAWVLGVVYLFMDVQGARSGSSAIAHAAHLGGAAFGVIYAWRQMNLASLTQWPETWLKKLRSPKLRILRTEDDPAGGDDVPLDAEVDRILEKISRTGEASLTASERETLTRASRRFKNRRG